MAPDKGILSKLNNASLVVVPQIIFNFDSSHFTNHKTKHLSQNANYS